MELRKIVLAFFAMLCAIFVLGAGILSLQRGLHSGVFAFYVIAILLFFVSIFFIVSTLGIIFKDKVRSKKRD